MPNRFQYIQCEGSAYFKIIREAKTFEFQYIQCEGSAMIGSSSLTSETDFNTSNVKVQHTFLVL